MYVYHNGVKYDLRKCKRIAAVDKVDSWVEIYKLDWDLVVLINNLGNMQVATPAYILSTLETQLNNNEILSEIGKRKASEASDTRTALEHVWLELAKWMDKNKV